MSWYEQKVASAIKALSTSYSVCAHCSYNRSTYFSGLSRYDFVIGSLTSSPFLIEVHGEQHYRWIDCTDFNDFNCLFRKIQENDVLKERLALEHGSPLLVLSYKQTYNDDKLGDLIRNFLVDNFVDEHDWVRSWLVRHRAVGKRKAA